MPTGCLETPQQALEIVTRAGRPNGGILLDAYHFHRGPADREKLCETIPPELVAGIQLNDADAELSG